MTKLPLQTRIAVKAALEEDLSTGDVTTATLFPTPLRAQAALIAQEDLTIGGLGVACQVFGQIDSELRTVPNYHDGDHVRRGTTLLCVSGDARSLLQGERVALNFLQHLSGIATMTKRFCQAIQGYPTKILDTRKTIPGLRTLQKWAVTLGGGLNHRHSLGDGILIKDNHRILLGTQKIKLDQACKKARAHGPHHLRVCVEVESFDQLRKVLTVQPDVILLDNMTPEMVKKAVNLIKGRALVEVSGGITLANVRQMAESGADFISIGVLTHSSPAVDISMEIIPLRRAGRTKIKKFAREA